MKNIFKKTAFLLLIFSFFTVITAEDNDVRYLNGHLKETHNNYITLSNGLTFKADKYISTIGLTPVYVILKKDRPEGYFYFKGEKVTGTLMKGKVRLATNADLVFYNKGKTVEVAGLNVQAGSVKLTNGTEWYTADEEETGFLTGLKEGQVLIIPEKSVDEGVTFINPINGKFISVVSASKVAVN